MAYQEGDCSQEPSFDIDTALDAFEALDLI
jgi:hypothetical protein